MTGNTKHNKAYAKVTHLYDDVLKTREWWSHIFSTPTYRCLQLFHQHLFHDASRYKE